MRHCLIVDDSDIVRKVARRVLEDLHITSTEAETADEAMDCCNRAMPDLILLDWHMPQMPPQDFLAALRHAPGGDEPVVIYCTTENDSIDIARARQNGANEIMMKPFDTESLRRKLYQVGFGANG
jgi:two-component system, chemotaxis family, chemotaxis protein CheY